MQPLSFKIWELILETIDNMYLMYYTFLGTLNTIWEFSDNVRLSVHVYVNDENIVTSVKQQPMQWISWSFTFTCILISEMHWSLQKFSSKYSKDTFFRIYIRFYHNIFDIYISTIIFLNLRKMLIIRNNANKVCL